MQTELPLYQPYAGVHGRPDGPGDSRPTALQVVHDCGAEGVHRHEVILITGASSGIGVETARALYETGAQLYITARNVAKAEDVIEDIVKTSPAAIKGPRPQIIRMEMSCLDSVRQGAREFLCKATRLDTLICNAGVTGMSYSKTADGIETQFGVNHMAHFLLFQLLKPQLLRTFKETGLVSRVIVVTSGAHRAAAVRFDDVNFEKRPEEYNKISSYAQSKIANLYMANCITRRYGAQGLRAWAVNPGHIATDLSAGQHDENFYRMMGGKEKFEKHVRNLEQGASTQVWAAVSEHFEEAIGPRYLEDTGEMGMKPADAAILDPGHGEHAFDREAEEHLWRLSCQIIGMDDKD